MLLAALIWGAAFVAQTVGMETVGPFTFSGIRISMGALTLLPVALVKDKMQKQTASLQKREGFFTRRELQFGAAMGIAFFVACNLQQYGLKYTTPGKAAFVTALYIVLVPIAGIFLRRKSSRFIWASVAMAFVGLYFLCVTPDEKGINLGDVLAFLGSFFFTVQILLIEKSGDEVDGVKLSLVQFIVCGGLSLVLMFLFEAPTLNGIWQAILPMLYAGVLSGGVAYTLQIIGQRMLNTTVASLLMSMESVFAVLTAWIIMGQSMSGREIIGCVVMFVAIVVAQLPSAERIDSTI